MLAIVALCAALSGLAVAAPPVPLVEQEASLESGSSPASLLYGKREAATFTMCGKDGDKEINAGKCGLGLCCSASGWCGTTDDYCTGVAGSPCQSNYGPCKKATPKKCGTGSGTTNGRSIGYYQAGNMYWRACNRIAPKDIDTSKYTHLYFSFAFFNPTSFAIEPSNPNDVQLYKDFVALKSKGVKTWIAIGGYQFSNPDMPSHKAWSNMVSTAANRKAFITSLKSFMDRYGFQGVDLDWEFPVLENRGGQKKDIQNLVLLVKEMRAAYGTTYGISMALPMDYSTLQYFDVKAMESSLDWFGAMTYDLHGFFEGIGSTIQGQTALNEIETKTAPLWFAGLDFKKINFGLATYGRGFTIASPTTCSSIGCAITGPNKPALCTSSEGIMSLTEIKSLISRKGLTPKLLEPQKMKSIQWDDQWIGYDDEETFSLKRAWANDYCFGGTMTWSVDYYSGIGSGDNVPETNDGTCGDKVHMRCSTVENKCCSSYGWCGDSTDHCASSAGCQSLYGLCT